MQDIIQSKAAAFEDPDAFHGEDYSSTSRSPSHSSASVISSPISKESILDIRRNHAPLVNLRAETLKGLQQPTDRKYVPSLLVWDDHGQRLYNNILVSGHYYPYSTESNLLKKTSNDIAEQIYKAETEIIVELGAGNMEKTSLLLRELDGKNTPLTYYALDVDRTALESSLRGLQEGNEFRNIELRALEGTYEDGAAWLATAEEARHKAKTLVWLGNSIANLQQEEAGKLLGLFTAQHGIRNLSGFVVGIDGCRDQDLINRAYDVPGGHTRRWVRYALEAAAVQLGTEAERMFNQRNWEWAGRWDSKTLRFENYLAASQALDAKIGDIEVHFNKGELIHILGSGKWTPEDVERICVEPGLEVKKMWNSQKVAYGIYWLQAV